MSIGWFNFQLSVESDFPNAWFCIAVLFDWLNISRHFLNQSEAKSNQL